MPPHQEAWCDEITEHNKLVKLAPAGHGKTTVFSVINSVHEIAKDRGIRIGLVTNTDVLAENILSEIKGHLTACDRLIETYGEFKPKKPDKWSKWQIDVSGSTYKLSKKDATITAFGCLSAIKGARFDLILGDDIVDEKNSKNADFCDRVWDWLWGTLFPRADRTRGPIRIKLMGTVENENDIYHRFMDNPHGFHVTRQQAIVNEQEKRVLWPEGMPYSHLAEFRAANYHSFMKTYQNIVVGSEVAKISQDKIDSCFDPTKKMYPNNIPQHERDRFQFIISCVDPAWTTKRRSKYAVILTAGMTKMGQREVLDIFREKVEYDTLFAWIKSKYSNLLPHMVVVESNQMQHRLAQELENAAIPTRAIWTSGAKNDINVGIPMLYSVISAGKLSLPSGDQVSSDLSHQLMAEILSYPHGKYSDMVMALYFFEQEVRKRNFTLQPTLESTVTGRTGQRTKFSKRYY